MALTAKPTRLNPKPRDHTDGAYMNQLSNEHLSKVIKQGGTAVGKSPIMPPHADLSDQQIGDIVTFVRSLASPPYKGN
jgi:cytochrome c1